MFNEEEVPFGVTEEVEVQDLTDVKAERSVMPVSRAVKVRIAEAAVISNENKETGKPADTKGLKLELRVSEGVAVTDPATGETEYKYKNKPLFVSKALDLCYWADMTAVAKSGKNAGKVRSDVDWWKKNQQYVGFKAFCEALGISLKGIKINDAFLSELKGRELLVDIQHEKEQVEDPANPGTYVDSGSLRERLTNWKKIS